jgi:hypothetical protein
LFLSPFFTLRLKKVVLPSAGFETALDEVVKNCKALAEAADVTPGLQRREVGGYSFCFFFLSFGGCVLGI